MEVHLKSRMSKNYVHINFHFHYTLEKVEVTVTEVFVR